MCPTPNGSGDLIDSHIGLEGPGNVIVGSNIVARGQTRWIRSDAMKDLEGCNTRSVSVAVPTFVRVTAIFKGRCRLNKLGDIRETLLASRGR